MKKCLGIAAVLLTALGPGFAKEVGCRIELDRSVLPAGEAQKAVIKVTLDAPKAPSEKQRPPVTLSIVLDRSGSMGGAKLKQAKEAAIQALRRLGPRDIFSLIAYNSNVETLVPAQSARNTAWIEKRIRGIKAQGNTALFGGVSQGAAEIRKHLEKEYIQRIVLLSDGLANVGPNSPADLGRLGAALLKEDISVTTIGVGADFNEDLMTRLAQKSDGNHYFAKTSDDLPRIFSSELGDVLSIVARKVIIEIEFPSGVKPLKIIGREGRIRGSKVEVDLNQLYGAQEKYALVEVEIPAAKEKETKPIAVAHCRYENAITLQHASASASVTATFSAQPEVVVSSANAKVQTELIKNQVAISKDKAIELWEAGKRDEAVEELRRSQVYNTEQGERYKLPKTAYSDALDLEKEAQQLEEDGLSKIQRKRLRSDSYQTREMQKIVK